MSDPATRLIDGALEKKVDNISGSQIETTICSLKFIVIAVKNILGNFVGDIFHTKEKKVNWCALVELLLALAVIGTICGLQFAKVGEFQGAALAATHFDPPGNVSTYLANIPNIEWSPDSSPAICQVLIVDELYNSTGPVEDYCAKQPFYLEDPNQLSMYTLNCYDRSNKTTSPFYNFIRNNATRNAYTLSCIQNSRFRLSGEGEEDILEHEIKVAGEDAVTVTTYTLSNKFLTTSDGSVDYHVNYTQ
jgi:hypothetical protein